MKIRISIFSIFSQTWWQNKAEPNWAVWMCYCLQIGNQNSPQLCTNIILCLRALDFINGTCWVFMILWTLPSIINYQLSSDKEHKMGLLWGGIVLLYSSGIPLMKMKWSSINCSRIRVCLRGPRHRQGVRSISYI